MNQVSRANRKHWFPRDAPIPSYYALMKAFLSLLFALLIAIILTACAPGDAPTATVTPSPSEPQPSVTVQPATPEPVELTLWLPDWMALEESAGHEALMAMVTIFEKEQGVRVTIVPKRPRGPGGLLDWLQKTQPVAPSLLPDIIALPFQDIPAAARADLLQPLSPLFPEDLQGDLYPFAQEASMADEAWMSLPFAADFEHLAFQPAALSEPPATWDVILTSNVPYLFPYGGAESAWTDAIILHYLSATPNGEDPVRNRKALRSLLEFYEAAYRGGLVDPMGAQITHPKDAWESALQGSAPLAETTASLWLAQQGQAAFLRFGPTPTRDGKGRYLMHGWAYAIVTADETRQNLAVQLISDLMATDSLARWSYQAHVLPARRTSLMQWPANDFHNFAFEAMEKGFLQPAFTQDKEMARSVHQAVLAVLTGQMTAKEAWDQAVAGW